MLELPPNPAWRLVPRMPMKIRGNAKSATIRWRSRSSLMKSRWASARIAEASLTGAAHDLEVRVLEARRVGLHDAERCLDAPEDRVDRVSVQLDLKRRAATRRVTESRELVAQQDLRVMQEAPHDLELPSHPTGEGLHRFVDVARNPKELRELLHLRAITVGHEPIGWRVREDAVEDRVEADVLLGREVLVEAWPLEDDSDLAAHGTRLAADIAAVDRRAATCGGQRG